MVVKMEMKSPPPCPATVTVRRNPVRKARATPASAIPISQPLCSPSLLRDIFSTEVPQNPISGEDRNADPSTRLLSENLKVYLRIRPEVVHKHSRNIAEAKNAWPKNTKVRNNLKSKTRKTSGVCVQVSKDLRSVTVLTPQALQETKRIKSEVYEGFSYVFTSESSQSDVYEKMVKPLVEDFLTGKSAMLAAMGPSGSGKTHTVFGCAREPGMVPLALRHIFRENGNGGTQSSRLFNLSMFEISSEKGKAEKMIDLLHDGGDICMQNSVLKGLQEAVICDAQQAESLIAHGMQKRATALTNSNSQSSRSQCIINIQYDSEKGDEDVNEKTSSTMLTIVDLAGAEREKKTGNQGARLLESNFINNTSMVFGLCLRSLLEHQKNRKKPLQKHYQNSLLTRYLRDYLEGKKRMMLILTVKPGEEDYLDTSFLLRQASPFTKIKFKTLEEPVNLTCSKRPNQALPRAEQKKMKLGDGGASLIAEGNINSGFNLNMRKEISRKVVKDCPNQNIEGSANENSDEIHVLSDGSIASVIQEKLSLNGDHCNNKAAKDREYQIMQGLSKALWSVLKEYKKKLEGIEIENCHLRDSLSNEKTRNLDLENKLAGEKMRSFDLENELNELKSQCTCCNKASADVLTVLHDASSNLSQNQMAEWQEVNTEVSSYSLKELEQAENKKTDHSARDSVMAFASDSGVVEEHYPQPPEDLLKGRDDAEDVNGFEDASIVGVCSRSQELPTSSNDAQDLNHLNCYERTRVVDMPSTNEATSQLISTGLYASHKLEQDAVSIVGDVKNVEPERECLSNKSCPPIECESAKSSQDFEDPKDAEGEPTNPVNGSPDEGPAMVKDQIVSVATHPHTVLNSAGSPPENGICFHIGEEQLNQGQGKEQQDPLVTILPKEEWDSKNMPKCVPHLAPSSNFLHKEKPKRRLLPVSSLLVKDISTMDIKDENDKPKGGKGGKRVTMDDKIRTQGSLSLLNLLTSKRDQ